MDTHKQKKTQINQSQNKLPSDKKRNKKEVTYNNIIELNLNEDFPDDIIFEDDGITYVNRLAGILNKDLQDKPSTSKEIEQVSACSSSDCETDILSLIALMSSNIEYLIDKIKSLTEQMSQMEKNSVLKFNVDRNSTNEEDIPLLQKSDIFQLPITEQAQLEELENELNSDQSFKIFFVSQKYYFYTVSYNNLRIIVFIYQLQTNRLVPIVKNLYQSQRHILWGFIHSLISKELLVQYTWSGRSESNSKRCFSKMKQIQNVLFGAVKKVIPKYTLIEFEADFKANLLKSMKIQ